MALTAPFQPDRSSDHEHAGRRRGHLLLIVRTLVPIIVRQGQCADTPLRNKSHILAGLLYKHRKRSLPASPPAPAEWGPPPRFSRSSGGALVLLAVVREPLLHYHPRSLLQRRPKRVFTCVALCALPRTYASSGAGLASAALSHYQTAWDARQTYVGLPLWRFGACLVSEMIPNVGRITLTVVFTDFCVSLATREPFMGAAAIPILTRCAFELPKELQWDPLYKHEKVCALFIRICSVLRSPPPFLPRNGTHALLVVTSSICAREERIWRTRQCQQHEPRHLQRLQRPFRPSLPRLLSLVRLHISDCYASSPHAATCTPPTTKASPTTSMAPRTVSRTSTATARSSSPSRRPTM